MKKPLFFAAKGLTLIVLSLFLLNACGDSLESPEAVMKKAKEAITEVGSGHVTAIADVEGQNGEDDLSFDGSMDLTFDNRDEEYKKVDLHVMFSGDMRAAEKALSGKFDLNFVTVDKQYYVKLNELSSSDESLTDMQPLIDMYKSKWLRISEEIIPQDIRDFQGEDEATKLRQEQLKELFRKTTLFDVVKEYGIEKYNGEKVYHYGIRPNMEGFKDYMVKAAIINGRELTSQEVEEAVKVLTYIKDAELYIDADDYYVLKSVLTFSGAALSEEADASLEVKIVIEGADYNESVSVRAPEGAEDFNPLNLMMGFGAIAAESDEEAMPEVKTPEETVIVTETEEEATEE